MWNPRNLPELPPYIPDYPNNPIADLITDDSVVVCEEPHDTIDLNDPALNPMKLMFPTKLMLDIAEIKLNKDEFAKHRDAKSFHLDTLNDTNPLFNGTGVVLKNDDPVQSKRYTNVRFYIRKMAFDGAKLYKPDAGGWNIVSDSNYGDIVNEDGTTKFIFKEEDVNGFDFNQVQVNAYYDTLRVEENYINRVFPLEIQIPGAFIHDKDENEVLEIRLLVKNFFKKYEYVNYNENELRAIHYFALSDWLRDVGAGENDIGGNIVAVARCYIPRKVGSISGTNNTGHPAYVIAIPAGESLLYYALANPAGVGEVGCSISKLDHDGYYTFTITTASNHTGQVKKGDWIEITSVDIPGTYFITEVTATTITFYRYNNGDIDGLVNFTVYPASNRDINPCDLPAAPSRFSNYIEPTLDYYLDYEKYKYDWNNKISECNDLDSYETSFSNYCRSWDSYNMQVTEIRLPPLAVYVEDGDPFTLENVMPGAYNLYITNVDVSDISRYGTLFYNTEFTAYGTNPVTLNEKQVVTGISF